MGLEDQNRLDLINLYWDKSQQTMEEAEIAISATKWNMAANRIYYSLFHAVTALLVKDKHPVGTHRGAKAALGQYYVLTGKLTAEDGRFFAQMETLRDKADYDIIFSASEDDINRFYPLAKEFLSKVKILLDNH